MNTISFSSSSSSSSPNKIMSSSMNTTKKQVTTNGSPTTVVTTTTTSKSDTSSSSSLSENGMTMKMETTTTTETTMMNLAETYPRGDSVPFPYDHPYPQQVALMDALLQGICCPPSNDDDNESQQQQQQHKTRILCLESPTGTGKSLSLACASFTWLDYQKQKQNETTSPSTTTTTTSATSSSSSSWWDDWEPEDDNEKEKGKDRSDSKNEQKRREQLATVINKIRKQYQNSPNDPQERRLHILRQAVAKEKIMAKKQRLKSQRQNNKRKKRKLHDDESKNSSSKNDNDNNNNNKKIDLRYDIDDDDDHDDDNNNNESSRPSPIEGSVEWLLTPSSSYSTATTKPTTTTTNTSTNNNQKPYQIIYTARTHTQLAQFVSEVQKTKWGQTLRVVTLGSRSQGLCGYLSSKSKKCQKTETQWTEQCSEARKSKSCTYYNNNKAGVSTLALHSLTQPTDIEDMIKFGKETMTCSYYATRQALPNAELIVLPYQMLVSSTTRDAIGLSLHSNQIVLIDEAHNLPNAIASIQSCRCNLDTLECAMYQVTTYTTKYLDRLSSRHLHLLGQLKVIIKGLIKSIDNINRKTHKKNKKNENEDNIDDESKNNSNNNSKRLWSPSEFLCEYRLDTVNLFPIVRYLKEEQISRKLLGFLPPVLEKATVVDGDDDRENDDDDNDEKESSSSTTASNNNNNKTTATKMMNKKKRRITNISPMSSIETLLHTLNYSNSDGKILTINGKSLEYVVLNPAVHAQDDLFTKPYAVALVGGTLQPIQVLMQELIPTYAHDAQQAQDKLLVSWNHSTTSSTGGGGGRLATGSLKPTVIPFNPYKKDDSKDGHSHHQNHLHWNKSKSFGVFSCGHVVSKSHVLLQGVNRVDGVAMDIRYGTRETPPVCRAIGSALKRLCKAVPRGGVVVFFPSYNYLNFLVDYWKRSGHWKQLQETNNAVLTEPKDSKEIDKTLARYSRAATSSARNGGGTSTKTTALLLSVVGGKLSEGINFANDMCRCVVVVGLPFADRSDPLLQEKLKLVSDPSQYYRSLCLRAVNQSVGRAIRHAKDYASIVLLDARYSRDQEIARGLPSWLTDSTPEWRRQDGDLNCVVPRVQNFLDSMVRMNK